MIYLHCATINVDIEKIRHFLSLQHLIELIKRTNIGMSDIQSKIDDLDVNKGTGSDTIPPVFVKSYESFLVIPL